MPTGFPVGKVPTLFAGAGKVWFRGDDGSLGTEPWVTDGTAAGTMLLADVLPGPVGSQPRNFTPVGTGMFFTASTLATGEELYYSDGTAAGTGLFADLYPSIASSSPSNLVLADGDLFFQARDPFLGKELFRLEDPGAYAQRIGHSGSGASLSATPPLLGSSWTIRVEAAPADALAHVLSLGPPLNDALGAATLLPSSATWLDPLQFTPLSVSLTPDFELVVPVVPPSPSLAGVRIHLQCSSLPLSILPVSTSNGVSAVFAF